MSGERSPESVLHEVDYWRLALADMGALSGGVEKIADTLVDAVGHLVVVGVMFTPPPGTDDASKALTSVGEALAQLRALQAPLENLIALAGGRAAAIRAEVDGEHGDSHAA